MKFATHCAVFLSLAALAGGAQAQQTRTCTEIASLPFTISSPGSYCLNQSLQLPGGRALIIAASDVAVDFNGNTISNPGPNALQTVFTSSEQRNITIRNGTIRGGSEGIALNGNDHIVENMRIEDVSGIGFGIDISGNTAIVRNNFIRGVSGNGCCGAGIIVGGTGARITGNQVLEIGTGTEAGIKAGGGGVLIEGNQVANVTMIAGRPFYGIEVTGGKALVARNYVHNFQNGIVGINANVALAIGNTVSGASNPFLGGVTLGGSENLSF